MAFDPDAYLQTKGQAFDPDTYLSAKTGKEANPDKSFLQKTGEFLATSKTLPVTEGIIGAVAGGGIPGAALGGAAGEAQRQLLARSMGMSSPATPMQAAAGIGTQGAIQGAGEAAGQYILGPAAKAIFPYIGNVGKWGASQLESLAGAAPGSLSKAAQDFSLMFGRGKQAIGALYDAAKSAGVPLRDAFRKISDPKELVDSAMDELSTLNPTEALAARQALDQVKRRVTKDFYAYARSELDSIAKQAFAVPDAAYQRAIASESLRNIFPQNKLGGASAFKLGIVTALENMGFPGRIAGAMMSPAAMGTAATGLGLAARVAVPPLIEHPQIMSLGLRNDNTQ